MEWLLIIGGVISMLVVGGRKKSGKSKKAAPGKGAIEPNLRPPITTHSRRTFESRPGSRKPLLPARWVQPGETVKVGLHSIESGMFYLGGILPGQSEGRCGNCVVDPTSRVASSGEDRAGASLSYWPSFQGASPAARRTYLDWLAGGREDPDIGVGYVFLFFYGVERRLFVDNAQAEVAALIAEVHRLLRLYGRNGSFRNYATRFLDTALLIAAPDAVSPVLSPDLQAGYEMPMAVRIYLGKKLSAKIPLDANDALMWILSLPDTNLRTAATRCFDELVQLWGYRFAARHPDGLKVNPPKTRLKLEYRAASGSFTARIDVADATGPLPDIAAISAPIAGLRDLLSATTEELGAYSRLLGRKPEVRGTLEAALLLPKELGASLMSSQAGQRIDRLLDGQNAAGVTVAQLADALSLDIGGMEKIPTSLSNQIGACLDYMDVGFEPDRRYGASPLRPAGHVVMFKALGGGHVGGEAPVFSAARAMVDVAALAAGADDRVDSDEVDAIAAEIRNVPELGTVERARLIAYASTLLKDTSLHSFALNKLKTLDAGAKQSVLKSAMAAILADGHASPAEVKFLERLHKALGLPVDGVYSMLHRRAVVIDEPVTVMPEERTPGLVMPALTTAPPASNAIQIDHSRLERLRSETSAVSALLAGIFTEEEASATPPPIAPPVQHAVSRFTGLNAAHAALLETVLRDGSLNRDLFDEAARGLRLLPDGAIERINDWGFDLFQELILEGDDELAVAPHILTELTEMEVAE